MYLPKGACRCHHGKVSDGTMRHCLFAAIPAIAITMVWMPTILAFVTGGMQVKMARKEETTRCGP